MFHIMSVVLSLQSMQCRKIRWAFHQHLGSVPFRDKQDIDICVYMTWVATFCFSSQILQISVVLSLSLSNTENSVELGVFYDVNKLADIERAACTSPMLIRHVASVKVSINYTNHLVMTFSKV